MKMVPPLPLQGPQANCAPSTVATGQLPEVYQWKTCFFSRDAERSNGQGLRDVRVHKYAAKIQRKAKGAAPEENGIATTKTRLTS